MTNLETLAADAVHGLVLGDAILNRALAAIQTDSGCRDVDFHGVTVEFVDESACRHKGVYVRGTLQVACDHEVAGYAFDAFVTFASLEAEICDLVLDDEDLLSFAA